jgi:CubicO group peptidase (beta-lactamase class C family)
MRKQIMLGIALLVVSGHALAQPTSTQLDSFILEKMQTNHIPGLAGCIVKDGRIVWTGSYGTAHIGKGREVADSTLFIIGSVSKTVASVAVLKAWERGLFGLDDDINDYLTFPVVHPQYPDSIITPRMLLTHTSAIAGNPDWSSLKDSLSVIGGDSPIPLDTLLYHFLTPGGRYYRPYSWNSFPPGSEWEYSGLGICLAACLVQAVTGTDFATYTRDSIFLPLGMTKTSWFYADLDTGEIAMSYSYDGSYTPYGYPGKPNYASGNLKTSTVQLARFLAAIMNHGEFDGVRILDSATVRLMTTVYQAIDVDQNVGLTWLNWPVHGRELWGHPGSWKGYRARLSYCPEDNAGIVLFCNARPAAGATTVLGYDITHELYEYASRIGGTIGNPYFEDRVDLGLIEHSAITEASGIVASRKNPNVLWIHNDSGDPNRVFALNTLGEHLGIYTLVSAGAADWEDIAIGPGPIGGEDYLYVGDFGDNAAQRDVKTIYRVPEPVVDAGQLPVNVDVTGAVGIKFRYPDGSRDAEALLVDPLTGDIYVVSKRETQVRVYRAPFPQSTSDTLTLEHVQTLDLNLAGGGDPLHNRVTGGDIDPSGLEIVIKTYKDIWYWYRSPWQPLRDALAAPPREEQYVPEPMGEAVCWEGFAGGGYYTVSEERDANPAHLYFYPRVPVSVEQRVAALPSSIRLEQNFPNPFNPSTTIRYELSERSHVVLRVFSILGEEVWTLVDEVKDAGSMSTEFHAGGLASGVYIYRLQAGSFAQTRKMLLMR